MMEIWIDYIQKCRDCREVMINPDGWVYADINGKMRHIASLIRDTSSLLRNVQDLLLPTSGHLDLRNPAVEEVVASNIRLSAIIPPLSPRGLCVVLRRINTDVPYTLDTLHDIGMITAQQNKQIKSRIMQRKNIVIAGATGSGKTTLLNAMLLFCVANHPCERIVTIEETPELHLEQANWINLSASENTSMSDLVRCSLRLRPDRLMIGECRGDEIIALMQAVNTGHSGSFCTLHANRPDSVIPRLALLASIHQQKLNYDVIVQGVTTAFDDVIFCKRHGNGAIRVSAIEALQKQGHARPK